MVLYKPLAVPATVAGAFEAAARLTHAVIDAVADEEQWAVVTTLRGATSVPLHRKVSLAVRAHSG